MKTAQERFDEKWTGEPNSGCHLWTAGYDSSGYGLFWLNDHSIHAHRAAWIIFRGPIPAGMHVLHRCDVRICSNPNHLFLGSNADNMKDRDAKGRQATGLRNGAHTKPHRVRRGERNGGARLTETDIRRIRADLRPQRTIAADYGVSQCAIHFIKSRKTWCHVD